MSILNILPFNSFCPPVISGTSIRVIDIAVRYEIMGMSPEDIIIALPHLNLSQIHDALSYYYEHKKEIDRIWRDSTKKTETLKKSHQIGRAHV